MPTWVLVSFGLLAGALSVSLALFLGDHLRRRSRENPADSGGVGTVDQRLSDLREQFRDLRADVREQLVAIEAEYEKNRSAEKRMDRKRQEIERAEASLAADREAEGVPPWEMMKGAAPDGGEGAEEELDGQQIAFLARRNRGGR